MFEPISTIGVVTCSSAVALILAYAHSFSYKHEIRDGRSREKIQDVIRNPIEKFLNNIIECGFWNPKEERSGPSV